MHDLIIVGGGPGGCAAGIYAARKKMKTLLLTKSFGGQFILASRIENFVGTLAISGFDLSKKMEEHARAQEELEIITDFEVLKIEKSGESITVSGKDKSFSAKSVILALGSHYKRLEVPGADKFEGKGLFYCSICDAPLFKNKRAVVIGGGNSGLGSAQDLVPYASHITVVNRPSVIKGDLIRVEELKKTGKVDFIVNAEVCEIEGDDFVKSVVYVDKTTGEKRTIQAEGAFVAIGYAPNTDFVKDVLRLDEWGHVVVDPLNQRTSEEGIWAAGDMTSVKYNQLNIAIGDAIKAVLDIYETLQKQGG